MMDLIDRADVHDLIANRLSDYLTDETRLKLEMIDCKIEDCIPTVQAVPIEKIQTLINDIEVMRTNPALIDNDDVQKFAENVLFALNRLVKESGEEQANANQHNSNALNALKVDAISRQAVNEIINDIRDCISVEGYCAILERMKKLPSVNPQEPKTDVLGKIRTEIEELADADGYGDYQLGFSFGLMMAMEIIDKYRAERSDKE